MLQQDFCNSVLVKNLILLLSSLLVWLNL